MSARIRYHLEFDADTSRARSQVQGLFDQLNRLNNTTMNQRNFDFSGPLARSTQEVTKLQTALRSAVNTDTGRINFHQLNTSLAKTNTSLLQTGRTLASMGPQGQRAFASLARSVAQADTSVLKTSKLFNNLKRTLTSTIGWQFSSGAIHGFMGSIKGAMTYAKDLDKSLNNIRIVTGQSKDQMAEFAKNANKSAQTLSTSTKAYADAALIFYQQGLDDKAVKERTDTTMKMVTVTGESASEVSSYMTAIWNNFDDGSKSLEYYADVLAKLGASTAASTKEIAGGLEKFAAVADTVGLSYEYATAALTTIIDKTRQSEDVVGTALKTIFARIQGLQQGEEQDDGVTLNKYSKALANVGVQIIDNNGELKEMDKILDEMGAKWEQLGKAEQVALAQTVGGTRQYQQVIALMDNWESMQDNISIAEMSEGSLQEQADIYAESWEGSQKRVKAAMEEVYQGLINSDFFIKTNNVIAEVIKGINNFTKAIGGAKGAISLLSTVLLNLFRNEIASGFNNLYGLFNNLTGRTRQLQQSFFDVAEASMASYGNLGEAQQLRSTINFYNQIANLRRNLNESQQQELNNSLNIYESLLERYQTETDIYNQRSREAITSVENLVAFGGLDQNAINNINAQANTISSASALGAFASDAYSVVNQEGMTTEQRTTQITNLQNNFNSMTAGLTNQFGEIPSAIQPIIDNIRQTLEEALNRVAQDEPQEFVQNFQANMLDAINSAERAIGEAQTEIENQAGMEQEQGRRNGENRSQRRQRERDNRAIQTRNANKQRLIDGVVQNAMLQGESFADQNKTQGNIETFQTGLLNQLSQPVADFGTTAMMSARSVTSFVNALNALSGITKTAFDPDLSTWEKISSIAGSAAQAMLTLTFAFNRNTISTLESAGAQLWATFQTRRLTTATTEAAIADEIAQRKKDLLNVSTKTAASTTALSALALSHFVVIAGLVVAAIVLIYKAVNKERLEREKANKVLENSKKHLEETSKAYDELKSSIDSLKSAQDTLDGLTKGTREWKEAVLKLNEQVLILLDKYPELAKYITKEDGVLNISDEGLDYILDQSLNKKQQAMIQHSSNQSAKAQLEKEFLTNEKRKENVAVVTEERKYYIQKDAESGMEEKIYEDDPRYQNYAKSGNAPEIEEIVEGRELGKVYDAYKKAEAAGAIDEQGKVRDTYDGISEDLKKAIEQNVGQLAAFGNEIEAATEKTKQYSKMAADAWVEKNKEGLSDDLKDSYATAIANAQNDEQMQKDNAVTTKDTQLEKDYAEAMGLTHEEVQKKVKDKALNTETMQQHLTNEKIAEETAKVIDEKLSELYANDNINEDLQSIVENIIASNGDESSYDSLTSDEFNLLREAISDENNKNNQELIELIGKDIADAIKTSIDPNEYATKSEEKRKENFETRKDNLTSQYKMDEDAFNKYADSLEEDLPNLNELMKENNDIALEAIDNAHEWSVNGGKLQDVLENNKEALADTSNVENYAKALSEVAKSTSTLLGTEVTSEFVENNKTLIEQALEGSREAVVELKRLALEAEVLKNDILSPGNQTQANTLKDQIFNTLSTMDIGEIDWNANEQLWNNLMELAEIMGWGADEAVNKFKEHFNLDLTDMITHKTIPYSDIRKTEVGGEVKIDGETVNVSKSLMESQNSGSITIPVFKDKGSTLSKSSFTGFASTKPIGSKSSSKGSGSKKDKKQSSDEIDRYHVIKETIEELNKDLDKLGKEKDRAFGNKKLKLMDQEISKLKELEKAQKEYNKQIEANYAKDKSAIAAYGAKFDENGVITNYEQLVQAQIDKFNKSRTDAAEEEYEKFKDTLSQYEETHDLLRDEKEKLIDLQNQIYDAALEKIDYKVELQIEINEDDLNYLEYLLGKIEDEAFNAAEAIALMEQQLTENVDNQKTYIEGLNEIFAGHGLGEDAVNDLIAGALKPENLKDMDFTEGEIDQIKGYKNSLLDINKTLLDLRKSVWEEVKETLEEINEKFEEQSEIVEHSASILEHYDNIIGLVGQDMLGISDAMKEAFGQAALDTAIDSLTISKEQVDTLKDRKAEIEQELASTTDEATRKGLQASLDQINEDLRSAEDQMLSDWENALEKANEIFEEKVKTALKTFTDAIAGEFKNIETLQDQFEKTRELDEYYVDDYKKIYELSKLTRDINRSIDETDNLASKQALRDIQQEINDLQEAGVEMSQYDLDHLRAKYELRLAEIALEDAQNAKSQVRMTRDSEGNWSYTYTADQQNIDQATQNYEDKLYKIQELSSNYIKDVESQVIELSTAMAEEISAIDRTVYASEEEYNAEVQRITDFYQTKMAILSGEMTKAFDNNNVLYTQDWTNYSLATGYKISADKDFLTNFGETTAGILTGFTNMETYQSNFNKAIGSPTEGTGLLGGLAKAYSDWQSSVNRVMEAAGTSISGFGDKAKGACDKAKVAADNAAKSMKTLKEETDKAFKDALQAALDFEKDYDIDGIIKKNEAVVGSINKIIDGWKDASREQDNYNNKNNNSNQNNGSKNNSAGSGGDELGKDPTTPSKPSNKNMTLGKISITAPYSDGTSSYYAPIGYYNSIEDAEKAFKKYIQKTYGFTNGYMEGFKINNASVNPYYWKKIMDSYDTGGYTGKWGSSGKIAMLHEKELVLNAQDTENMLKSIEMVRAIAKTIDLNAAATLGWGGLSSIGVGNGKQEIVQAITINAEFPNATDQNEIKAAFDNLFIRASQYANRK